MPRRGLWLPTGGTCGIWYINTRSKIKKGRSYGVI